MEWTPQRLAAFEMVYQGRLTQRHIAAQLGIRDRTLRNWQRDPDWKSTHDRRIEAMFIEMRIHRKEQTLADLRAQEARLDGEIAAFQAHLQAKYGKRLGK